MLFASSTVEPIGQDLSEIVDVNAFNESDIRLQRISWVNEGIEVLHRRAVPQEGVMASSSAVSAKPVTCPEALMARPSLTRAPQRAEVLHRRAVPQERMSGTVGLSGVARHLPRGVDGNASR